MTALSQAPKKLKELQTDKKMQADNLQQKTAVKNPVPIFLKQGLKL